MIYDSIFKNKIPLWDKLPVLGFILNKGEYTYSCPIVDGQFNLIVTISEAGKIHAKVMDPDTQDEYVLHLSETAEGAFVGKVRKECANILQKIADNGFASKIFQSMYADEVIRYIKGKYGHDLEYLWEKFPENAVVRRSDNQKWYAALLTVVKNKIGLSGNEKIEILDLRVKPEELEKLVDGKKYFSGYHMNKKHWLTICLNGSVPLPEIYDLIDESYALAKK